MKLIAGTICIDNENIENYTLDSLRKTNCVVLQDVFLFADTIYNNITLNDPAITRDVLCSQRYWSAPISMSLPDN
jgi:ABC-type multidrug transport system fused ATPase/permease subunit